MNRNVIEGPRRDLKATEGAQMALTDQTWPTRLLGRPPEDEEPSVPQAERPRSTLMSFEMNRNVIGGPRHDSKVIGGAQRSLADQVSGETSSQPAVKSSSGGAPSSNLDDF